MTDAQQPNKLWLVRTERWIWVLADNEADAYRDAVRELDEKNGAAFSTIQPPQCISKDVDADYPREDATS